MLNALQLSAVSHSSRVVSEASSFAPRMIMIKTSHHYPWMSLFGLTRIHVADNSLTSHLLLILLDSNLHHLEADFDLPETHQKPRTGA